MRTFARLFKYFKLILVVLPISVPFSLASAEQQDLVVSSSSLASQIERPHQANFAPQEQQRLVPNVDAKEDSLINSASNNGLSLFASPLEPIRASTNQELDQTTSPSVTSVHQVWTSSSSGRLDELSPEIIGKLHNDVPFLAAYALRPRLVGAPGAEQSSASRPLESYTTMTSGQLRAPSTHSSAAGDGVALKTGASSPHRSLSQLTSLGGFSEFNVETLSTSKSEHRHKRKTVLKKNADDALSQLKRGLSSTTVAPIKTKKKRRVGSNNGTKLRASVKPARQQRRVKKRQRSVKGKRTKGPARRGQLVGSGRQKRKSGESGSKSSMSITRHGRYYQEQTIGAPINKTDSLGAGMDVGINSVGGQTTMIVGGTKGDDVKGGVAADKTPFYSRARPPISEPAINDETEPADNGIGNGSGGGSGSETSEEERELAELPEPKRVGDDDVEEDGDTVTVMPKFDGVNDDPELPADGAFENGGDHADQGPREREEPANGAEDGDRPDDEQEDEEPRTRRINREWPNDGGAESTDDSGGDGLALGAGIGATTGGAATESSGNASGDSDDDNNDSNDNGDQADKEEKGNNLPRRKVTDRVEPDDDAANGARTGVAGAGGSAGGSAENSAETEGKRRRGSGSDANPIDSSSSADRPSDSDRKGSSGGSSSSSANADSETDELDVDYRDEMAEAERKWTEANGAHEKTDCDDGSYNHYAHHGHHESTKWLRGTIPGEPGEDYPTLSQVNTSSFSCADKKLPGYYADVESRCQVFHICQADGRQDSFL